MGYDDRDNLILAAILREPTTVPFPSSGLELFRSFRHYPENSPVEDKRTSTGRQNKNPPILFLVNGLNVK